MKSFLDKSIKNTHLTISFSILAFAFFLSGAQQPQAADFYRINNATLAVVDEHSNCQEVDNTSGQDFFVPTKSTGEWTSFLANNPTGIALADCPTWVDLRWGGDFFTHGNAAGNDIRYRSGMSMARDTNGMSFSGANVWSSWVKFESLGWTRGSGSIMEWIITNASSSMMIGIGSAATNETSATQITQAETLAYFTAATSLWGLYGNSGVLGYAGNQSAPQSMASGGIYKIKFTGDGGAGGVFTLYQLPSASSSDWDDESTVLKTVTIAGSLNPNEVNIMPFIVPRSGGTQRFVALRVTQPPTDGVCDNTAQNACTAGLANDGAIADTATYSRWRCDGISGGADSGTCQIAKINGVCNNATTNSCTSGSFVDVADTTTEWRWQCDGQHGGTDSAMCVKAIPFVNGGWSNFGGWGACSVSCGGGNMYSYRYCNSPTPSGGGAYCSGSSYQSASCNTAACPVPVNGGWSNFGSWGACSTSCGPGTKYRYRTCSNPYPANGGANCSGLDYESTSCNPGSCAVNGVCGGTANTCAAGSVGAYTGLYLGGWKPSLGLDPYPTAWGIDYWDCVGSGGGTSAQCYKSWVTY